MKRTSMMVTVFVLMTSLFVGLGFLPEARATTLYVGGSGPGNYTTIQAALDDAFLGDTVYIFNGTYFENVIVSKTLSLIGEERNATTINGNGIGDVIRLVADWVNITELTLENSGNDVGDAGIELSFAENCSIVNNTLVDDSIGIYLNTSNNNTITGNDASSNYLRGIYVNSSSNNAITNNSAYGNRWGIHLEHSTHNVISGNGVSLNSFYGMVIYSSDSTVISDNDIHSNEGRGILLDSSTNTEIIGNVMSEDGMLLWGHSLQHWNTHMIGTTNTVNGKPIYYMKDVSTSTVPLGAGEVILANCTDVVVEDQNVSNSYAGIQLGFSSGNRISNNTVTGILYGIRLESSNNNTIANNSISANAEGMFLEFSNGNRITDNTVSPGNQYGIHILSSDGNSITGNTASEGSYEGIYLEFSTNNTIANNTASRNWPGDGIYLHYSDNNTIAGNTASRNRASGLYFWYSSGNLVTDNIASDNWEDGIFIRSGSNFLTNNRVLFNQGSGIRFWLGGRNTVIDNNVSWNGWDNIYFDECGDNTIAGNIVAGGKYGIRLGESNNNNVTQNTVTLSERVGIYAWQSDNNSVDSNNITHDTVTLSDRIGIHLLGSAGNMLRGNTMVEDGILMTGTMLQNWNTHKIDTSNTVNGKAVIYWKNATDGTVPPGTGEVILANCTDIVIRDQNVSNGSAGILIGFSSNITVRNNSASGNYIGIGLYYSENTKVTQSNASWNRREAITVSASDNNTIAKNTISSNILRGVSLWGSRNNLVYHNKFRGNVEQACDDTDSNQWDNGYPSGGNFWSDYTGVDEKRGPNQNQQGSDGIGDTPYVIDADSFDRYPLISPGTVYHRPPENVTAFLSGRNFENVTITWDPSPDESTGLIDRYDILRGENFNTTANLYTNIGSVPNGTHQFVDAFAGEGNPNTYFYAICAINMTNDSSCADNQAGKFTRPLTEGPNLASVPLIQSDEIAESVLQTVEYDKAWFYDSSSEEWKWYMTSKGYRRGLLNINHTMGLWMNVTEDSNLTVAGVVPAQTTIHLHKGWNLVSFPSFNESYTVADLKALVPVERVETFDSSAPPYFLRVLADSDVLLAGQGYWVKAGEDAAWIVSIA